MDTATALPRNVAVLPAAPPASDGALAEPGVITPLPQAIAELEARTIQAALAATGGNKLAASRLLGISRATLYEKLAAFGEGSVAARPQR
jgi:DNA-binding NtrC family response regulator